MGSMNASAATPGPIAYAWIDGETTGIDIQNDHLLEISMVLTDIDLNEIATLTSLVRPTAEAFEALHVNQVVYDMHLRSGLLNELRAAGPTGLPELAEVEASMVAMIDHYGARYGLAPQMRICGGGVAQFDQHFLHRLMPSLSARFHYRPIDISIITQGYRDATRSTTFTKNPSKAHRAEVDIREDLDIARVVWPAFRLLESLLSALPRHGAELVDA